MNALTLSIPLQITGRAPIGARFGGETGGVDGRPAQITLTDEELHVRLWGENGPAGVVNLMDIARAISRAVSDHQIGRGPHDDRRP